MDSTTLLGSGMLVLAAAGYAYPKVKTYLASRNAASLPHDHVKALIDYGTEKKCEAIVTASVTVGKLLYEECTEHVDGNEQLTNGIGDDPSNARINNLP